MQTRRTIIASMLSAVAAIGGARAEGDDDDLPKATVIKGKPPYLDFNDGVKVPCSKAAFLTLWEGPYYWLTFGYGSASLSEIAQTRAAVRARGAMRYLLLTLAFAPERLAEGEGKGWRQKVEKPENYVMGDLELPGRPSRALDDLFLGRGNVNASEFWGQPDVGGMVYSAPTGPGGPQLVTSGMMPSMSATTINAFCCYIVRKKDLSLADVRQRAKILKI
jgi:hypothetical protein